MLFWFSGYAILKPADKVDRSLAEHFVCMGLVPISPDTPPEVKNVALSTLQRELLHLSLIFKFLYLISSDWREGRMWFPILLYQDQGFLNLNELNADVSFVLQWCKGLHIGWYLQLDRLSSSIKIISDLKPLKIAPCHDATPLNFTQRFVIRSCSLAFF